MAPSTIINKAIFVGGGFMTGAGPRNRWPNKVTKAKTAKEEKKGRKDKKGKKEDGGGAQRGKKDINTMSFDELKKEAQRLQTAMQVEEEEIARKRARILEMEAAMMQKSAERMEVQN